MKVQPGWCVGLALAVTAVQAFEIRQDATNLIFSAGGRPVLVYRHAGYPFKPYAAQLCSPAGVAVLRDAPADHKHHHALMFAVEADGVNFWEETATGGRELARTIRMRPAGFTQQLDWQSPTGNLMLRETRILQLHVCPDATLLTWRTQLATPPDKAVVTLGGHHYFGLGARFLTSMDATGTFQNASGAPGTIVRGTERLVPARWCAYTAAADGKTVTFALFDHPANPRYPNRMFTMTKPFAYLAATLNLWKEPLEVKAGAPLELRHGVALLDGPADAAQLEKLYRQWLSLQ